jgi:centromere protein S
MGLLRTFSQELKGKEPAGERKRKKSSKDERVIDIDDDGM